VTDLSGDPVSPSSLELRKRLPVKPDEVVLTDEVFRVRPAVSSDVPELHHISNGNPVTRPGGTVPAYDADHMIWRYMPEGQFGDVRAFGDYHQWLSDLPNGRPFVVEDVARDELVGSLSLLHNDPSNLKVGIGAVWYSPPAQGAGVNQAAVRLLLGYLFDLGYERVGWICHSQNKRSRSAALRLGFRFEGVQEHHMIQKGHFRDTAQFRILRDEWVAG